MIERFLKRWIREDSAQTRFQQSPDSVVIQKPDAPMFSIEHFLMEELRPYPGRLAMVAQVVALSTLWVIFAMTLMIPAVWLSAYMIFMTTRRDSMSTAVAGYAALLGCSIALLMAVLLFMFAADEPAIRVPMMAVFLFAGMYFSSILTSGRLVLSVSSMLAIMLGAAASGSDTDLLVRNLLWMWLAYTAPVLLLVLTNLIFSDDPARLFEEGIVTRLELSALAIKNGPDSPDYERFFTLYHKGMATLRGLQSMACLRYLEYKERSTEDLALISLVDRLMAAVQAMPGGLDHSPEAMLLMHNLAQRCFDIKRVITGESKEGNTLAWAKHVEKDLEDVPPLSVPIFAEVIECLSTLMLAASQRNEAVHGSEKGDAGKRKLTALKQSAPFFLPDAFTNPEYLHFSLKTTLAAMLAYLIYMGLDWNGAYTCMVSCVIVARSSYGETIHRLTMRLVGVLAGAVLGVASMVLIMPELDSIIGLGLLVAGGSFICAWVAMGSDRISFLGMQMALAFFLCVLHAHGPSTNIAVIRDSLLGIILGNLLMSFVFFVLWPSSASKPMRKALASGFDNLRKILLLENSLDSDGVKAALPSLRQAFDADMAVARGYLPFLPFEPRRFRTRRPGSGRADALLLEALFTSVNTIAEHRPPKEVEDLVNEDTRLSIWYCNRELAGWFINYAYVIRRGEQVRPQRKRMHFAELEHSIRRNMHSKEATPLLRAHLKARLKWYHLLYSQMELAGREQEGTLQGRQPVAMQKTGSAVI